jgi:hypothetical protein
VLGLSEDPRSERKEILMPVRASSLNYRDLMVLKGGGRGPTKIGVVPLFDDGQPLAFPAVQKIRSAASLVYEERGLLVI